LSRSHFDEATRGLHNFFRRPDDRFGIAIGRRTVRRNLLAAFAIPSGRRIVARTANVSPARWIRVALSWAIRGDAFASAQLVVRPFFSGCGPRSYRDIGFRFESEQEGGRLTWLPNVRGPKVIADTNGRYHDEPARSFDCLCRQATASASLDDLITPGSFEFELRNRPSVLIFSMEGLAKAQRNQHVGAFLAGLIQDDSVSRTNLGATRGPRQERARSSSPHDHEPGVFHVRDKSCAKYCWPSATRVAQQSDDR